MGDLQKLHTDPNLLSRLMTGAASKRSAAELEEQRVSFIFGAINSESEATKDEIRDLVRRADTDCDSL